MGQTQTTAKGLNRHLHMHELGLQGLYKQLLGYSLRQGICNHLGAREYVFYIHAPSHSFLKNHGVFTQPQICQRSLATPGPSWHLAPSHRASASALLHH